MTNHERTLTNEGFIIASARLFSEVGYFDACFIANLSIIKICKLVYFLTSFRTTLPQIASNYLTKIKTSLITEIRKSIFLNKKTLLPLDPCLLKGGFCGVMVFGDGGGANFVAISKIKQIGFRIAEYRVYFVSSENSKYASTANHRKYDE